MHTLMHAFESIQTSRESVSTRMIATSFDVFDTVLMRRISTREIFRRVGLRASREWADWDLDPVEFAAWREVSEERAARASANRQFVLHQLYEEFGKGRALSAQQIRRLVEIELEIEAMNLQSVPVTHRRIAAEHALGRAVLFLSDTYVPSTWLRHVLSQNGLWADGDEVFASCELQASKAQGPLYAVAAAALGVRLQNPIHLGDNYWSDVLQARRAGWLSEHFTGAQQTSREALLASHSPDFGPMPETLAGAAREARLKLGESHCQELQTHIEIATAVAAPILVAYVLWCLREAKRLGLKRLYFLTRDGLVLHAIFEEVAAKLGEVDTIEARILGASRQVARIANFDVKSSELPGWATYNCHQITVTSCLTRVGLQPDDFRAELERTGLGPTKWERPLTAHETEKLRRLLHQERPRKAIEEAAGKVRSLFEAYLFESGLHDNVPAGFVDIGWHGSTFNNVLRQLPVSVRQPLHLFLFGFISKSYDGLNGDQIHAYYCDDRRAAGEPPGTHLVALLEDFVAVEEGTLVDFSQAEGGQVQPVFRATNHSDLDRQRFAINKSAPCALIQALSRYEAETWPIDRMAPVWRKMMDELWMRPTEAELNELSVHQQEVDQSGHVRVPLAVPYTMSETVSWLFGLRELFSGISAWSYGRRALTRGWARRLLLSAELLHRRWPGIPRRIGNTKRRLGRIIGRQV